MKSLKDLYAKMDEDDEENRKQLRARMEQMNKAITETNREVSSEDSDRKAESLINFLKQEVEELKQQNGIANQKATLDRQAQQNDDILSDLLKDAADPRKHDQGVLQQQVGPTNWLGRHQTKEAPAQKMERNLPIFDIS